MPSTPKGEPHARFVVTGPKDRIAEALKSALDNHLVEMAISHQFAEDSGHSKTGVSYHSKCGHGHSKASRMFDPAAISDPVVDRSGSIERLASEIMKLRGGS